MPRTRKPDALHAHHTAGWTNEGVQWTPPEGAAEGLARALGGDQPHLVVPLIFRIIREYLGQVWMETHTPSNAQLAARLKERLGKIGVTDETPPLDQYVEDILDDAALLEGIATRPPANSLAPNDYRKLLQKAIDHLPTRTRPRKDAKKYLLFRLGKLWWGHHGLPPRRSVDVEAYAEGKGERGAFMDFVIEVNALLPENARLGSRPYIRELVDHINANEL